MIAIKSNKKLMFPPVHTGYVKMEIDLIQNKPSEGLYSIRIVDTCYDIVTKDVESLNEKGEVLKKTVTEEKILGINTRVKDYSYSQLRELAKHVNADFQDKLLVIESMNELFKKGLLFMTQTDCALSISGPNRGMYFSEAKDWSII